MSPPVLLACDAAYGMQLATSLRSIVESNRASWPLDFFVLTSSFSETAQNKVLDSLPSGSASIRWIPVDMVQFRQFSTATYISTMTFARLLIPSVFPESVSRVLYLDADLLVLGNLSPLWDLDLDGHVIGGVIDAIDSHIKANTPGFERVPRVREYFNAGVLLIDLDRWRKECISERALEYLSQTPLSPYSDQDALNVACDGRWKQLDPRWNFQNHRHNRLSSMPPEQMPVVVHFVMQFKPWIVSSLSLNADLWDDYRSRTCFARTPLEVAREAMQLAWYRSKYALSRYALLRAAWHHLTAAPNSKKKAIV